MKKKLRGIVGAITFFLCISVVTSSATCLNKADFDCDGDVDADDLAEFSALYGSTAYPASDSDVNLADYMTIPGPGYRMVEEWTHTAGGTYTSYHWYGGEQIVNGVNCIIIANSETGFSNPYSLNYIKIYNDEILSYESDNYNKTTGALQSTYIITPYYSQKLIIKPGVTYSSTYTVNAFDGTLNTVNTETTMATLRETITTRYGTFPDCIKLTTTNTVLHQNGTQDVRIENFWYAKNLGKIKFIFQSNSQSPQIEEVRQTLVAQ